MAAVPLGVLQHKRARSSFKKKKVEIDSLQLRGFSSSFVRGPI